MPEPPACGSLGPSRTTGTPAPTRAGEGGETAIATTIALHLSRIETALTSGQAARSALVASWARSAQVHGLDPVRPAPIARLTDAELAAARGRLGPVLSTAAPHLDRLFQTVGGLGACVVLADRDGLAVDRRGAPGDDRDFAGAGLWTDVSLR